MQTEHAVLLERLAICPMADAFFTDAIREYAQSFIEDSPDAIWERIEQEILVELARFLEG